MLMLSLSLLLLATPVFGAEPTEMSAAELAATKAEVDRLSGEIKTLASRQVWGGVERKYRQALALGLVVPGDVHLIAAYSARDRGDLIAVYDRLTRAAGHAASKEVVDWLWDLDHNFGRVTLKADRKRTAALTADMMPLDPNRRQAVEAAILQAKAAGKFKGLLPRGSYNFSGQDFRVEPGISVRVEVSAKVRRHGITAPTIVYHELPTAKGQERD